MRAIWLLVDNRRNNAWTLTMVLLAFVTLTAGTHVATFPGKARRVIPAGVGFVLVELKSAIFKATINHSGQ